jgi:hypothetical protein
MPKEQVRKRREPLEKVYTSVAPGLKAHLQAEADRRGLQVADVIRELLMEKYGAAVGRNEA